MPDGFTLSKDNRVRLKSEFNHIFSRRKRVFGKYIFFYIARNGQCPKIGFIVSKKGRNAVQRNHLKNQLRDIFRHMKHELEDVSIVIGIRGRTNQIDYSELKNDLESQLRRAGCMVN